MDNDLTPHIVHVYRFCLRLTRAQTHSAEDVLQETLLRALRSRSSLNDAKKMRAWLLQIATNVWRDWCRKQSRSDEVSGQLVTEPAAGDPSDPVKRLILKEEVTQSLAALDALPDRQRSVLYLTACEQLSLAEIADVLSITPQAAKSSLSIARAKLRKTLNLIPQNATKKPGARIDAT